MDRRRSRYPASNCRLTLSQRIGAAGRAARGNHVGRIFSDIEISSGVRPKPGTASGRASAIISQPWRPRLPGQKNGAACTARRRRRVTPAGGHQPGLGRCRKGCPVVRGRSPPVARGRSLQACAHSRQIVRFEARQAGGQGAGSGRALQCARRCVSHASRAVGACCARLARNAETCRHYPYAIASYHYAVANVALESRDDGCGSCVAAGL
jgi:hypothetical protein